MQIFKEHREKVLIVVIKQSELIVAVGDIMRALTMREWKYS